MGRKWGTARTWEGGKQEKGEEWVERKGRGCGIKSGEDRRGREMENESEGGKDREAVSYTHLTLPTRR